MIQQYHSFCKHLFLLIFFFCIVISPGDAQSIISNTDLYSSLGFQIQIEHEDSSLPDDILLPPIDTCVQIVDSFRESISVYESGLEYGYVVLIKFNGEAQVFKYVISHGLVFQYNRIIDSTRFNSIKRLFLDLNFDLFPQRVPINKTGNYHIPCHKKLTCFRERPSNSFKFVFNDSCAEGNYPKGYLTFIKRLNKQLYWLFKQH